MNCPQWEELKMNDENEISVLLEILSLEDSEYDFEIIREKLLSAGYNVKITRVDDEKAFVFNIRNIHYDIILADFNLPDFDAFHALKLCNQYAPYVPFICVSGSIGEITAIELLKLGAVDYVLKDRLERLPFAVKRAMDEAKEKKEHKYAEISLEKSEEKFRNLFENHAAPKLIIDATTNVIVDANHAASRFYGWSIEELKKMKINDINTASSEVIKNISEKILNDDKLNFEFQHRCKDGSIKDVEVFSSKVLISGKEYFHSIIHDITDKKKAEQKVQLLSLSIDQSPVSITITNTNAEIEYVNPAFCEITGYSAEEVIGKVPNVFTTGKLPKKEIDKLVNRVESGKVWNGEFLNSKKNGELFWENVSISPLLNEHGQITHYVSVKEDITEKKKMIEDLIASKEKAEKSDKLKTAFMNNISHEIRTPLNGILGFGQLLADENLSPEERKHYFSYLNKSSERLINTVTNFMDISIINSGNQKVYKNETDPSNLINTVIQKFEESCKEKNLTISLQKPSSHIDSKIIIDEALLSKSIYHLVDNAIKFTNEGTITVGYEVVENKLNIFVKDTGIGISEENKNLILRISFRKTFRIPGDMKVVV